MTPFFIVGCGRSGTTLLQTLIDGHPAIAIPPESQIYERFGTVFDTYGDLAAQRNRERFITDLLRDAYIQKWRLPVTVSEVERRILRPTRAGVIEALFTLYAESQNARRWGDKTPAHIRYLREIRQDFPQAKLIHLVRDGRDTAEAMRRMIWYPVSAVGLAHAWRREVMHWDAFCKAFGTAGTLLIHYEDLVTRPQAVLAQVLDFIGEPFADTTVSYHDTSLSKILGAQQAWHGSLRSGISASKVGIYAQKFTPREIEIFESIAGDALDLFGYTREFSRPRPPGVGARLYAPIKDRLVRWYRKLFHLEVVGWDLQVRARNLLRRLRVTLLAHPK